MDVIAKAISHVDTVRVDGLDVYIRKGDSYINVSDMFKHWRRSVDEWRQGAGGLLNAISNGFMLDIGRGYPVVFNSETTLLSYTREDNRESLWAHPRVAMDIARYISVEFGFRFESWVLSQVHMNC